MKTLFGILALAAIPTAFAASVQGTSAISSTAFTNLNGNMQNQRIKNDGLTVAWGCGSDKVTFTPTCFNAALCCPFKVGQLTWKNDSKSYQNGQWSATLNVGLKFDKPGIPNQVFNLDVSYAKTKMGESITLPTNFQTKVVTVNNIQYTIKLKGFEKNPCSPGNLCAETWTTPNCTTSTVDLYGEVCATPVPEPASLAALGIGAAALLRRRKK